MSIDSRIDEPMSDLRRWYSGYLIVGKLSNDVARQVAELTKDVPFLDVGLTGIEVEYKGRDSSRLVVRALLRLARLIQNAAGEIRCEVSGDTDQLWFEFYRIRDGRLFRQRAEIARQPEHEVTDGAL